MSNEIIARLAILKTEFLRKKELEKRQREKLHKVEEEKRSRLSNDPRSLKNKHDASSSSAIITEEQAQPPQRPVKRSAAQVK